MKTGRRPKGIFSRSTQRAQSFDNIGELGVLNSLAVYASFARNQFQD
jgi:hypothetical protein